MSKIMIPKPCHENWAKMTSVEQGRHCDVCSKVVMDLSSLSNEQIIEKIRSSSQSVCGRIPVQQLTPANPAQRFTFRFKSIFYSSIALLGFTFLFRGKAVAQGAAVVKGKVNYRVQDTSIYTLTISVRSKHQLQPIQNAIVSIYFNGKLLKKEATGENGRISVEGNPVNFRNNGLVIKVRAKGFPDIEKTFYPALGKDQTLELYVEDVPMMLGEVIMEP